MTPFDAKVPHLSRPQSAILAAVCALLSFPALVATTSRLLEVYDEGIPLVGAMRVAAGDLPHRDFYSIYGPAPYYLLAAIFHLFGPSLFAERLYDSAIKAALVGAVFYLVSRYARFILAATAALATLVWLINIGAYGYVIFPAALLGLASSGLLVPNSAGRIRARSAFSAGALVGLLALFRYDTAGVLAVAQAIALAALLARRSLRSLLSVASFYALGCVLAFGPVAVAFVAQGALPGFLFDLFGIAAKTYPAMRRLPWPSLADLAAHIELTGVYLPLVALAAGAALAWRAKETRGFVALFAATTLAFLLKGAVRVSLPHMLMAIISGSALLAVVAEHMLRTNRLVGRVAAIAIATALLDLAALAMHTFPGAPLMAPSPVNLVNVSERLRPGFLPPPFEAAARYVAQRTAPTERIFVGRTHHDRLMFNAMSIYFASGRLPGTRWHHFDPGLQTRADIQQQIAADLDRNHVRYVVLTSDFDALREPNRSARSSGVHLWTTSYAPTSTKSAIGALRRCGRASSRSRSLMVSSRRCSRR